MRKEYEEQQDQNLMDDSKNYEKKQQPPPPPPPHAATASLQRKRGPLLPGKPITLEGVLTFTQIPQLVVQPTPPFLAVHANAAYFQLAGIDTHAAIGKPIVSLLFLPKTTG